MLNLWEKNTLTGSRLLCNTRHEDEDKTQVCLTYCWAKEHQQHPWRSTFCTANPATQQEVFPCSLSQRGAVRLVIAPPHSYPVPAVKNHNLGFLLDKALRLSNLLK